MPATTARRYTAAVVGLGPMGRRHARVLASLGKRFELAGAFDVDAAVAVDGVVPLGTEAEAIARSDLLVVATPIHAHAATVARALASGRHVLVEKPLCSRAAEADALVAAAPRGRLFVGHSERFNPVVRALARVVRAETVVAIDLQRVGPGRAIECGVLLNLAVHDLDLAAYLAGDEVTLRGAVGTRAARGAGEDVAHLLLSSASGAMIHVHVDRTVPHRRRSVTLQTTRWIYEGDLLVPRLTRTCRDTGARTDVPLLIEEPLVAQAVALADALDGGSAREIATAVDGARAVRLAELASARCAAEKLSPSRAS